MNNILVAPLAFDTASRHSNLAMTDWIADSLAAHGVALRRFYNPPGGRVNLYARLGPSGGGGVMLSGHTDVVPVDGQTWNVSPLSLTERDGRYYGRGSADMRGFLVCVLAAVDDFLAAPLCMSLHLAFSYDEEVGRPGVRSLVDFLQASSEKPALRLIDESTEMQSVFGHKGKLAMRCCIEGQACHSAYAPQGVSAIRYAARLIDHLDWLGVRLARQQGNRSLPSFSTLQVGTTQGGAALNIVPQSCRFDFEIRYLPGTRPEAVIEALATYTRRQLLPEMRRVGSGSDIQSQLLSHYLSLLSDPQSNFAHWLVQRCGSDCSSIVAFGTEGGLFDEMGVTILVCGPGSMARGHKADEYISIAQAERCTMMLRQSCAWTRAEPAEPLTRFLNTGTQTMHNQHSPHIDQATIDRWQVDGAVLLRDVSTPRVECLAEGVTALMASPSKYGHARTVILKDGSPPFLQDYYDWSRTPAFSEFVFQSAAAEIAVAPVQSQTVKFSHEYTLVKSVGGSTVIPWHHDQPCYCVSGRQDVSFWIPLDPVAEAISLCCIRGSYRQEEEYSPTRFNDTRLCEHTRFGTLPDIDAHEDEYDIASWALEPGDVVAFHSRIVHGVRGNPGAWARRVFSAHWAGDGAAFADRGDVTSPPFPELTLWDDDPLDSLLFPQVWPRA